MAAAQVYNWTGFFLGIEGGGGWGKDTWTLPPLGVTAAATNISGGLAGGVIGYNWQLASKVVLGVEGNLNWADINGNGVCTSNPALN